MSNDGSNVKDTVEAVKGIVEAVPIYQDAVQPAAKEVGKALQTVAKTVHIALAPVSALVWGYEQIKDFVENKVSEKLKNTPEEEIQSPKPNVAGPALEGLKYTGHEATLRELFANLLATSMDAKTASIGHPGFVEMIKQMTPDEGKLMKLFLQFSQARPFPLITLRWEFKEGNSGGADVLRHFSILGIEAKCENPELTPEYLDNLCRLGLIEIPQSIYYTTPGVYDILEKHPEVIKSIEKINLNDDRKHNIEKKGVFVTQLGRQFINACVIDHAMIRNVINKA